jgi:hypothetical protein
MESHGGDLDVLLAAYDAAAGATIVAGYSGRLAPRDDPSIAFSLPATTLPAA